MTSAEIPEVKYAKSGDVHIAYQVVGSGPPDLVLGSSDVSQLEVLWDEPSCARQWHELAESTRLILFDKRGVGLSDRNVGVATLEERMDDIRAVMEATGSRQAWLFGTLDSAALCILFAATYPERTRGLILWGGQARSLWASDYPWAKTREVWEAEIAADEADWGSAAHIDRAMARLAPSRTADPEFRRWLSRRLRYGASPAEGAALRRMNMQVDVRSALSAIHVPTLVMYTPHSKAASIEDSKFLAENIAGAELIEVQCPDQLFWTTAEGTKAALGHIRHAVEGGAQVTEKDRILTTVMFTDIVGSTEKASKLGDTKWGALLDAHYKSLRQEVLRHRGSLIKTTGDGALAMFDGPTRAIRCALALGQKAGTDGLSLRAGLHTGECIFHDNDIQGLAVHLASRIADLAEAGEVLVSGTVRDLSVGASLDFRDRGTKKLRGIDGRWRLFSVKEG